MNKVFTVALIGGIGSGKSTALNYFKSQGVDCISADAIARDLILKTGPCYAALLEKLGSTYLNQANEFDRDKIRARMLQDSGFKTWLEQLLHPVIKASIYAKIKQAQPGYLVIEIPLLKQRQDYPLNRVLYIQASRAIQEQTLHARGLSQNEINSLLAIQIPSEQSLALADDIIKNDSSLEAFKAHLLASHLKYLKLSQQQA